jgi:hypothetical protein
MSQKTGTLMFSGSFAKKVSVPVSGNIEIGVAGATRVEAPVDKSRG